MFEAKPKVSFSGTDHSVEVPTGEVLSKALDALSSPILFGCRTGICGTCLIQVLEGMENMTPASEDEKEFLEIVTDDSSYRLACQLSCQGDVSVKYIGKGKVKP